MAACESHYMDTDTDALHNGTSPSSLFIHSASYPANSNAINSDSIVDLAIQVCFADFQDIVLPLSKNIYPLVELTSSLSLTQFASQYLSSTTENLLKWKQ